MERAPDLRHAQRRADAGASARERRGEKPSDDDDEDVIDQSRARGVIGQAFKTDLGRVAAKPGTFGRDRSSSGRAKKSRKRSRRPPIDQLLQSGDVVHKGVSSFRHVCDVLRPTTPPGRGGLGRTSDSAALLRGAGGFQGGAARGERPLGPRRGWRCPGCVPTSGPVVGSRCPR